MPLVGVLKNRNFKIERSVNGFEMPFLRIFQNKKI